MYVYIHLSSIFRNTVFFSCLTHIKSNLNKGFILVSQSIHVFIKAEIYHLNLQVSVLGFKSLVSSQVE